MIINSNECCSEEEEFTSQFKELFELNPHLQLFSNDSTRGLLTNTKTNQIIHIPNQYIVTKSKISKNAHLSNLSEVVALCFWLLNGEHDQKWKTFIAMLPKNFDFMPFYINDEKLLNMIVWLRKSVDKQKETIKKDFEEFQSIQPSNNNSYKDFLWAWFCVNTRCISLKSNPNLPDTMALVPLLDMLNHTNASTQLTVDKHGNVNISSSSPIEANSEVFINYGAHDDLFLFVEYGFILTFENPYNFIRMDEYLDFDNEVVEILKFSGFYGDYTIANDGEPSFRLLTALRLQTLYSHSNRSVSNILDWKNVVSGESSIISNNNEEAVWKVIVEKLEEIRTTAEGDLITLEHIDDYHAWVVQRLLKDILEIAEKCISYFNEKFP